MKILLSAVMVMFSLSGLADNSMKVMAPTQMDDLIRGEMSAVKSYDQVIAKTKDEAQKEKLNMIREDHVNAVSKLKAHASAKVKEDSASAGVWGSFTKTLTSGAQLFGNKTALKALSEGEEHGVKEYREALEDDTINPEVKTMIKTELLPKQEQHLKTIKTFM